MGRYKIADVVMEFTPSYEETAHWYKPYETDEPLTWERPIIPEQEAIDYFVREGVGITPGVAENIVLCNKVNRMLLHFNGSFIHSSALLLGDKVYLFSGPSGVGKSTLTSRICRMCEGAVVINDDKPTFRLIDGKCIVYGTPFAGGTDVQLNKSGELGGVIFLEQSERDEITRMSNKDAIVQLMQQTPSKLNSSIGDKLLSMYSQLITKYPFYFMKATNSDNAAIEVINLINNKQKGCLI